MGRVRFPLAGASKHRQNGWRVPLCDWSSSWVRSRSIATIPVALDAFISWSGRHRVSGLVSRRCVGLAIPDPAQSKWFICPPIPARLININECWLINPAGGNLHRPFEAKVAPGSVYKPLAAFTVAASSRIASQDRPGSSRIVQDRPGSPRIHQHSVGIGFNRPRSATIGRDDPGIDPNRLKLTRIDQDHRKWTSGRLGSPRNWPGSAGICLESAKTRRSIGSGSGSGAAVAMQPIFIWNLLIADMLRLLMADPGL